MAENGPIEDVAKKISDELFTRFKWRRNGPMDQDFLCEKQEQHKPAKKMQIHTHPTDVVFYYKDPYLNKTIYFNTDLKSYNKSNINRTKIEAGLSSLAKSIACAKRSPDWQEKYIIDNNNYEIRGLLFVYNHDNESTKDFYEFFYPPKPQSGRRASAVKVDRLGIEKNDQIHIIEPKVIDYMITINTDIEHLIASKKFPDDDDDYGFHYPQLTLHKSSEKHLNKPATIELITSPYLIIKHNETITYNKNGDEQKHYDKGFLIYYNREGKEDMEFLYLLDALSNFQIFDGDNKIRIRVTNRNNVPAIKSVFIRALKNYANAWGLAYDEDKDIMKQFNIEINSINTAKKFVCTQEITWD